MATAEPFFAGGYIPEVAEQYERFPLRPSFRDLLPPQVDLSADFPRAGRQENQPSCVGWALAYATRTYYAARARRRGDRRPEPFSPAFIFNQSKIGNCQAGSTISAGLEVLKNQGAAPWSDFPYDPLHCEQQPSAEVLANAKRFRISDWSRVNTKEVNALKAELFQGNPIVFGMFITPSFYRLKSGVFSDMAEHTTAGHAMVIVGYDDALGAFKIFNSWGKNWGEHGFGWISYASLMARIQNAFVMSVDPPLPPSMPEPLAPHSPDPSHLPLERREAINAQINALKQKIPCSRLSWSASPIGHIAVQGSVGSQKDLERLESWRHQFGQLETADFSIQIDPWPLCPLIQAIKDHQTESQDLKVQVNGQQELALKEGDSLTISVDYERQPKHILILYIQADGSIVVLRNGFTQEDSDSGRGLVLGRPPENLSIGRPLGHEAVIALVTDRIFNGETPFEGLTTNQSLKQFTQQLQNWLDSHQKDSARSFAIAFALIHSGN